MMVNPNCKGCQVVDDCYIISRDIEYFILFCPCQHCIIKMRCSQTCLIFYEFADALQVVVRTLNYEELY